MSNMVIQTNMLSLNAHRNMGITGTAQARSSARLSSGFRINTAADDAAGLGISEKMRGQIRGLDQASRNAQDGISLIQTAEGAMQTVNDIVIRIRELTVQAANDTNVHDDGNVAQSDRARIQDEVNQLLDEIDQIAYRTEFNTRTLLNGDWAAGGARGGVQLSSAGMTDAQTRMGAFLDAVSVLRVDIWDDGGVIGGELDAMFDLGQLETDEVVQIREELTNMLNVFSRGIENARSVDQGVDVMMRFGASLDNYVRTLVDRFDDRLVDGGGTRTNEFTALLTEIGGSAFDDILADPPTGSSVVAVFDATSGDITSARFAAGSSWFAELNNTIMDELFVNQNLATAGTTAADPTHNRGTVFDMRGGGGGSSLWFHIGANESQGVRLHIENVSVEALGLSHLRTVTAGNELLGGSVIAGNTGHAGLMLESGEEIGSVETALLSTLDEALAVVTSQRSILGAMQNRLEFSIQNLDIASENLQAANSRIRDADMAREMMRFTQTNVLQQAAISMLAQANQAPQNILQLLR